MVPSTSYTTLRQQSALRRRHLEGMLHIAKIYVCVVLVDCIAGAVSKVDSFHLLCEHIMTHSAKSVAVLTKRT